MQTSTVKPGFYSVGEPHTYQDGTFYPVMHFNYDGMPGQCMHVRDIDMPYIRMLFEQQGRKPITGAEWSAMLQQRNAR
jgi:hypothetical protein